MDGNKSSRALPLCGLVRPIHTRAAAEGSLSGCWCCLLHVTLSHAAAYDQAAKASRGKSKENSLLFISTRLLHNLAATLLLSEWNCCDIRSDLVEIALFGSSIAATNYYEELAGASRSHRREYRSLALRRARFLLYHIVSYIVSYHITPHGRGG